MNVGNKYKIWIGNEVLSFLENKKNAEQWTSLWSKTSWSTVFQSYAYVSNWYRHYAKRYTPLLICRISDDGEIDGILALAHDRRTNNISFAGWRGAEYHHPLCRKAGLNIFMSQSLHLLKQQFPKAVFHMLYVFTDIPMQWIKKIPYQTSVRIVERPLLSFDSDHLKKLLKKKGTKSKINRLKKNGRLSFRRIRSIEEFRIFFYNCNLFWDLRHGAVHDLEPTYPDHKRFRYYSEILDLENLHVSGLFWDTTLIAGHIGFSGQGVLHIGDMAYSPFHSKMSPGNLHRIYLLKDMLENGLSTLDLTPGEDLYKQRFKNTSKKAFALILYPSYPEYLFVKMKELSEYCISSVLRRFGIIPSRFKRGVRDFFAVPCHQWKNLWSHTINETAPSSLSKFYLEVKKSDSCSKGSCRVNAIEDLLRHPIFGNGIFRRRFYRMCMSCMENGGKIYSISDNQGLSACAFIKTEPSESDNTVFNIDIPDKTALIYNIHILCKEQSTLLLSDIIDSVCHDLFTVKQHTGLAVVTNACDNLESHLMANGFVKLENR